MNRRSKHCGSALCGFSQALMIALATAGLCFGGAHAQGTGEPRTLFGDMGGLRPALAQFGVSLDLSEISEVLANVTGGVRELCGKLGDGVRKAA